MACEKGHERKVPLTIAFFLEGMYASGVDTVTQLLAHSLRKLGQRVVLFVPWEQHQVSEVGEDTFRLPALRFGDGPPVYLSYPVSLHLLTAFRRQKFDLVHIHTSTSVNLLAWQVAKLFALPAVYTYHTMTNEYVHYWRPALKQVEPLTDSAMKLFDKVICNGADAVIAPSAKAADYLRAIAITPPITVVPNGIDLQTFHPHPSDYLQRRFGVPPTAKILLFVGRLNLEKRPILAYEIFRALSLQRNDVALVIAGDGALRAQLAQMARRDGLQERLFLIGLIDHAEMPAVYNAADIWISTSISEVHPMVALEAVACGLPAVAWQDQALAGIVDDGVNGLVVNTLDDFVAAIQRLLRDAQLSDSMRQTAREKIQAFSIESTAQLTLQLYVDLLKQHNAKRGALEKFRERLANHSL